MTVVVGGSSPQITFADSTVQNTAFTGLNQSASPYTTALGYQAANSTTGVNVTAIGYQAGYSNTTGYNNVMFGYLAGYGTTTGYKNIFVSTGNSASITTGYQNIFIGNDPNNTTSALHDAINITTRGSLDKGSGTGYIDPNGGGVYQGNNSSTWSVTSDQRLKKNIVSNTVGLEKITGIQIRNFEYRLPEEVDPALKPTDAVNITGVQLGVIAQELQAVLPDCVKTESTGVMSVNSESVMWHLVTAVQQLNTLVTAQATEIAALKAKVGA